MKTLTYFYCPSEKVVRSVPSKAKDYWAWINDLLEHDPILLFNGARCTWDGPYSWTVQTYLNLRESGVHCELLSDIPPRGIIISHSDFWPPGTQPTNEQFLVEIKPDRDRKLQKANFTICQSKYDPIFNNPLLRRRVAAIAYWPQPALIGRATSDSTVTAAAFIGNRESFLHETALLISELKKRHISFAIPTRPFWNDYSRIDLVIAVRDPTCFLSTAAEHKSANRKPPNKLINAWLAGVPAILSREPNYLMLKRTELDFLEASSVSEVLNAVDRLISSPRLYHAMVANGRTRSAIYGIEGVVSQWKSLIDERLHPLYCAWLAKPTERLYHGLVTRLSA